MTRNLCHNAAVGATVTLLAIDPATAFVSYDREDSKFVLRLVEELKTNGAKVWMDTLDIRPGQRWELEVEAALDGCSRMLVILSPASVESRNVQAEIAFAIDEGKGIIPVLHKECRIPFRWRPFQYVDFRTSYDEGLQELLRTLSSDIAVPPAGERKDVGMVVMSGQWTVRIEDGIHTIHAEIIMGFPRRLRITWDSTVEFYKVWWQVGDLRSFERKGHSFKLHDRGLGMLGKLVLFMDGVEVPRND